MAQLNGTSFANLYGSSGTTFPDNTTQDISEGDARQFGQDIKDSYVNITDNSGSFTPTVSNTTNVASSTPSSGFWHRIGISVVFTGWITVTPTGAGNTIIEINLPVATNIDGTGINLGGTAYYAANATSLVSCVLGTSSSGDRAAIGFSAPDGDPLEIGYSIHYRIVS